MTVELPAADIPARDAALLRQANDQLAEVLKGSAGEVTAAWRRRTDDRGRPAYALQLTDWTGTEEAVFTRQELTYPDAVRARLQHLWGGLLQARVKDSIRQLIEMGSVSEEG